MFSTFRSSSSLLPTVNLELILEIMFFFCQETQHVQLLPSIVLLFLHN
jgi:hypothetical protein